MRDPTRFYRCMGALRCALMAILLIALPIQASTPLPVTRGEQRLVQMVSGIISYTQWSQPSEPIHLCVIDSPHYFHVLSSIQSEIQRVQVSARAAKNPDLTQQCHVLFFEHTPPAVQQEIINQRGVRKLLTLTLNNPSCTVGSSFCLSVTQNHSSFSVNLDSLKQSGVRISSKVLILAKPSSQQD